MFPQTLILYLFPAFVVTQMIVLTTKGPIRGEEIALHGGMTSIRFLGIPYAKPPLGHLRFQATSSVELLENNQWPVIVAFRGISKIQVHPPQWLFQHVVVVIVYYRLQVLGHLKAENVENSPALMDQLMALEWIHQNIISFGGDPDQVTIIGEGQTGNDVFALLFTPLAKGLFTGAGIVSAPLGLTMTSSDVASATRVLASRVDCPQRSMQDVIKCLKEKKAHDLIRQQPFNTFGPVWMKNLTCFSQVPLVIAISSEDGRDYLKFGRDILKRVMIFDSVFYAPAIERAKAHAQHAHTFFYELRYEHPLSMFQMIFDGSDTKQSVDEHVIRANVLALWSNFVIKGQPSTSDLISWAPISSSKPNCYEIDVESKALPSCRRINQAAFWKAIHVLDDSIDNTSSYSVINVKSQHSNLDASTGCAVAVTILTLICIFLFTVCLCVRHPQFHLHLASTFRNFISRVRTFRFPRRVPQTEVILIMDSSSEQNQVNGRNLRSRSNRRILVSERVRHKRHVLQDMARPLKQWLIRHRQNPYPTKAEKISLALNSQMTLVQVNNWFANARRRLKNVVRNPDLPWAQRIKLYNSHLEGNAEVLSISSTDSIWNDKNEHGLTNLTIDHSYSVTDTANECAKRVAPKYKTDIMERYLRDTWTNSCDSGRTSPEEEDFSGSSGSTSSTNRYWDELEAAFTLTRFILVSSYYYLAFLQISPTTKNMLLTCGKPLIFFVVVFFALVRCKARTRPKPMARISPIAKARGYYDESENGRVFRAFTGIPYAKPPIGDRRFKAPEPSQGWAGILHATQDPPMCLQRDVYFTKQMIVGQEDCLYLNVFAPPVSCSTEDESASGNWGLLDQIAALKWVQQHIASFGGDPNRVTLFGQGAGAHAVSLHLFSPLSAGLFNGAIIQSDSFLCSSKPTFNALTNTRLLAREVNCPHDRPIEMMDCLRRQNATHFIDFSKSPSSEWQPRVDNESTSSFLPVNPKKLIVTKGPVNPVPVIIGAPQAYILAHGPDSMFGREEKYKPTKGMNETFVIQELIMFVFFTSGRWPATAISSDNTEAIGDGIREIYFPNLHMRARNIADLYADAHNNPCLYQTAHLLSQHSSTWFYSFEHIGNTSFTDADNLPRASVFWDDLLYLFQMENRSETLIPRDSSLSSLMVQLWTDFARYGDPTPPGNYLNLRWNRVADGRVPYLPLKIETHRSLHVEPDFHHRRMRFWLQTIEPNLNK
uniref:Homeobox domain-containing protein n=1 Tax=Strigamia maritima TaxID=126957 RepID=T1IP84_STRMM